MPKPSAFSVIYRADDTAIFLDSIQNFRVADIAVQLIFSIFLHIHISKASILFISVLDIVQVSAVLHTRHLTIRFLKSRFILLVRIFFLSMNFTFANPILLLISYLFITVSIFCN